MVVARQEAVISRLLMEHDCCARLQKSTISDTDGQLRADVLQRWRKQGECEDHVKIKVAKQSTAAKGTDRRKRGSNRRVNPPSQNPLRR